MCGTFDTIARQAYLATPGSGGTNSRGWNLGGKVQLGRMHNSKSLKWICEFLLIGTPLLGVASCRASECDDAVFSQYSSLTLQFDKSIVVTREFDITIVGDNQTSQTFWYVDGAPATTGPTALPVYDRGADGGVGYTITSVLIRGAPSSLSFHLVADGVTVADGSATPTYQHLVESHENCSLPYDQASVAVTVQ